MAPPTPGPITPGPSTPQPEKFNYLVNMIVPIPKSLNIPKIGSGETSNAYGIIESLDDTGANVIALGDKHHLTTETLDNLRKEYPQGSTPWMGPDILWRVANMSKLTVTSRGPLRTGGISTFDTSQPELRNLQGYLSGDKVDWTGFRFQGSFLIKIDNFLLWQIDREFEEANTLPSELESEYNFRFPDRFTPGDVGSVVGIPKGTKAYSLKNGSPQELSYSAPYNLLGLLVEKSDQYMYSRVVVDGHSDYWFSNSEIDVLSSSNAQQMKEKYGQIYSEAGFDKPQGGQGYLMMFSTGQPRSPWYVNGSDNKEVYPGVNLTDNNIVYAIYNTVYQQEKKVGILVLNDNRLVYGEQAMPND